MKGPLIPTLPALDYSCSRCGVQIHHDSDTQLVRAVAVHHNTVMHRRYRNGSLVIRWTAGFAPPEVVQTMLTVLCATFGPRKVDLWVDELEAAFDYLRPEWLEECMELIARYVGPDLQVIDQR